ncbi:MAG: hypothetical protein AAGE98_00850 [Actinomycetota bacterium]
MTVLTRGSTVLIVAYGITELDLSWVPTDGDVVVVHNDDRLTPDACDHPGVRHVEPGANVGFGAGMNLALAEVTTDRVILCNPDTALTVDHFRALDAAAAEPVISTVPLLEADGTPNAVVNPYWSVPAFLATAYRLGRFAPRGGRARDAASRLLGRNGAEHLGALAQGSGEWSIHDRWVSGAVFSAPTAELRSVGGFDEDYFLYFEDADLHQRLAVANPDLVVRMADIEPAHHFVGGSAGGGGDVVARHRFRSARTYASRQPGVAWRVAERALVGPR